MNKKAYGNCNPQHGHYKMANERAHKFHNEFFTKDEQKTIDKWISDGIYT